MLNNYFKTAWRNVFRQRGSTLINVSGLAIGMCAAILIFMWVNNEMNFDNYHASADRIYRISNFLGNKPDATAWETSPFLLGEKIRETVPGVSQVARIRPLTYNPPFFNVKGEFIKESRCAYVDSAWFDMFHYRFIHGSKKDFNENPFSIVMTESKARKYFGDDNPIGREIRVDTINYQVRGIIADNPANSSFQYDAYFTVAGWLSNPKIKENATYWGNYYFLTFVKLLPDADPVRVNQQFSKIMATEREKDDFHTGLVSLKNMHFETGLDNSQLEHGNRKIVNIFTVLGLLLLSIACINYVNLTTARASMRVKEVSVKKIVGAAKKQLFLQFVLESVLTSLLSLALASLLLYFLLPVFNEFTGKDFVLSVYDRGLWLVFGGTFAAAVLLNSIYPAMLLSSFNPLSIFRGAALFQLRDSVLRKILVVVQFTISIALIIGTIVIYRQMLFIQRESTTFNRSQVFSFTIPFKLLRKYEEKKRMSLTSTIRQELRAETSMEFVSLAGTESVLNNQGWSSGGSNDWDGRDPDFTPAITFFQVDSSFRHLLNLQLREGRWFIPNSGADQHNSILNETAIREFNIRKPVIGQRFTSQGDTGVVIGVVKDFFYKSMHEKIGPVVIRNDESYSGTYFIRTKPGKAFVARDRAEAIWKQHFPGEPFSYMFLNDEFENMYRSDRRASTLIWLFSALAIFISCLGLYGLAAFTAERKRKEIGIRKVLGASVSGIVVMIARDFLKLVVVALVIASPLAWWGMSNWLQDFAYRVPINWWIFIAAGIIAILIAFASISFRAIKAAAANPVRALRTE